MKNLATFFDLDLITDQLMDTYHAKSFTRDGKKTRFPFTSVEVHCDKDKKIAENVYYVRLNTDGDASILINANPHEDWMNQTEFNEYDRKTNDAKLFKQLGMTYMHVVKFTVDSAGKSKFRVLAIKRIVNDQIDPEKLYAAIISGN